MIKYLRRWLFGDHAFFQHRKLDEHRGCVVAQWAAIESCLDQANHLAWRTTRGSVAKVVPQSLRWKLELFKKLHAELPLFQPLRAEAAAIVTALKYHQDSRH